MASTGKAQKDKHYPRLTPRSTAASAARAAHNATNRNLNNNQVNQKFSPVRLPLSPSNKRRVQPQQRPIQNIDSISDVKVVAASSISIDDVSKPPAEGSPQTPPTQPPVPEQEDLDALNSDAIDSKSSKESTKQSVELDSSVSCTKTGEETPTACSRPITPKSEASRPQTPSVTSRPNTPARKSIGPSSRPNTPQRGTPTKSPSYLPVISGPQQQNGPQQLRPPVNEEDDLKSLYLEKKRQFHRLKKELDIKQQSLLEIFDCLQNLSEQLASEGENPAEGNHNQIRELVVFNVGDWTTDEVTQLCREAVAASTENENTVEIFNNIKQIGAEDHMLCEADENIMTVPERFAELCLQAFSTRQELIDWLKDFISQQEEDGRGESLQRIARYNNQGLEFCEALRELKASAEDAVVTVTQFSRRASLERSTLVTVGESLVREIARLRQDLEARALIVNEMREIRAENETAKALEETRRQLEEERASRQATKEKLSTTEAQLRQTRLRVAKMDRQLREAEASIGSLTGIVKTLEDQSRQREVHLEARARKLKESLKTGEVVSSQIAQQRDSLQEEVQMLKDQISTLTNENKTTVDELNKEINEMKATLEQQRQETLKEIELRRNLEESLKFSQNTIDELKSKNVELENNRPNPELPTEREMDLWAELQATKDTLRMTEDEVTACKREKVRFLETLTKISETDNKVGLQQKLAAELLSKEEIIAKMQIQIRELTKNIKLNEQKVIQYEQYVRDLQAHNRAIANCQDAPNGISYQDLQQEIMNLKMSLLESVHRNDELNEILAQKEQQLEQQDKTSRTQARVIKVREELINMLKNKETEQSRELSALQQDLEHRMKIVDEVNKQIAAKAEEIQELFITLENKQQQIHRLEKIVLALEEQQRRAQAQRTRHEEKIAALEHELAAGSRRERKFIFF